MMLALMIALVGATLWNVVEAWRRRRARLETLQMAAGLVAMAEEYRRSERIVMAAASELDALAFGIESGVASDVDLAEWATLAHVTLAPFVVEHLLRSVE